MTIQLQTHYSLGKLTLRNRVVMAPMTRSRALGNVATAVMAEYYAQRASAGLIITEGIAPSPNGLGYARIPGLYSVEQTHSFRALTSAVHERGGKIFAQLMHTGRIAHPLNMPQGAELLAPSAIQAQGQMFTDQQGLQAFPAPREMSRADIAQSQAEFVSAARNAIDAGFDGIELHAANGYLLEQFMHPHSNRRDDAYGGSDDKRNRFVVELTQATANAIGADRVGIRVSPYSTFNDMARREDATAAYSALARALQNLAYVHVVRSEDPRFQDTLRAIREHGPTSLILNGGFDRTSAEAAIQAGEADLISFGRPFIANPDFVQRIAANAELSVPDASKFYTPGPEGYVDYASR
jgi:N-ethylmaleimide reductase